MTAKLCYRGAVNTWECDEMGHMNVRFYLGKALQGVAQVGAWLDLGPRTLRDRGEALVPRQIHIRYLKELHAGADLSIEAGVVEASEREVTLYQEILPMASDGISATLTSRFDLMGPDRSKALAVPDFARVASLAHEVVVPAHAAPRSFQLDAPIPLDHAETALERGHLPVSLGTVKRGQVDEQGYLSPEEYLGFISDGIGNLFALMTRDETGIFERTEEIGGAALEYRFDYFDWPRVGDLVRVLSAPVAVADKTYKLRHFIHDPESGALYAKAESVHCSFDLVNRKAISIPDRLRAGLTRHLAVEEA